MDIITITDNDINSVIAVYTLEKFLEEANKEYWEANDFNEDKEHFTLNTIDAAIDWYIDTSDNLSLDRYTVEDVDKPCTEVDLTEDDWYDTVINDELLVHIKRENIGYSVDLYDKNDLSDDGYISSAIAFDDNFVINVDDDNWDEEV